MAEDYYEKTITYRELDKIIKNILQDYMNMLRAGHMSFSEFAILENVIMRLNKSLDENNGDSNDKK